MPNLPITSREYKLSLKAERFVVRATACGEFVQRVRAIITGAGGALVSQQELEGDPEKRRTTWFLDTPGKAFRQRDFILRVRREKADEFALTLKFRSPDRYLSAAADVTSAIVGAKLDAKFEEDVLPPFSSKFSRSASAKKLKDEPSPRTVGEAKALFPALGGLGLADDEPVAILGGVQAHEVVERVGGFRFDAGVDVKMSFTFWYEQETLEGVPRVAEFSFDYDAANEEFPIATVRGASKVFSALQQESDWIDPQGGTKSDFAGGVV